MAGRKWILLCCPFLFESSAHEVPGTSKICQTICFALLSFLFESWAHRVGYRQNLLHIFFLFLATDTAQILLAVWFSFEQRIFWGLQTSCEVPPPPPAGWCCRPVMQVFLEYNVIVEICSGLLFHPFENSSEDNFSAGVGLQMKHCITRKFGS